MPESRCLPSLTVPSDVSVVVPHGPLYNGTEVNLTCTVVLNTTVDTMVNVFLVWSGPGNVSTDDCITCTLSEVMEITASPPTFMATLTFRPLASDHNGSYMCEAIVTSSFIIRNSSDTGTISVAGESVNIVSRFNPGPTFPCR